jgi:alpha-L-rhamnosidase
MFYQFDSPGQNKPFSKAVWISPSFKEDSINRPCPIFNKSVELSKNVKKAVLHITALGLYEVKINDKRVGKAYFTPGFTSYDKRLQYQVDDVTDLVFKGKNQFMVTVADGWYRGVFGGHMKNNNYGKEASLLFQLTITFEDESKEIVVSDSSWLCGMGMIRYVDFYRGELQDTRILNEGGLKVKAMSFDKGFLVLSTVEPVVKQESFIPQRIFRSPNGDQIVDFSQNMAGFVQLRIKGKKGDTVKVAHAEMLDRVGNLYTANLREAKAEDIYVLNGEDQVLEPHFTYHGFRYVKVSGCWVTKSNCKAFALYSNLNPSGTFSCSNQLINRLQKNILWSMKSNFVDIPTDCPQRSERLGWTGDAQVFCRTAALNRNVLNFYRKFLMDLATDQGRNGGMPNIIPDVYGHKNIAVKGGVAGWGDAATIIPWNLYEMYGDTAILRQQYSSMKTWVDYISSQSVGHLWKASGYGDWYAMGDSTSLHYIDQCFYAHSTENLLKAAKVLQKRKDIKKYGALLAEVKKAFLNAYGDFNSKFIQTQTAYVLALSFDLLPENRRRGIAAKLVANIHDHGNRLATGFLGTPYLLPVLSQFGYSDLAYILLLQQDCPSWLYPVKRGATTIWEKWDAVRSDGRLQETSFNHFAYGAVGQWFYEHILGIQALEPGYKRIKIKPEIGGRLKWVKGSYRSYYGQIVSEWKIQGKLILMNVEIPIGTTAVIEVPGKGTQNIGPGKYRFVGKL